MSVFEIANHFAYLKVRLDGRKRGRGIKTRFSQALRTKPAWLSQVLAEKYCLSLEQADLANKFFEHSKEESDFFLLLVSRDRAGTDSLRSHFDQQIQAMLKKRLLVVERLGHKTELTEETKGIFYSSWLYTAVQVSCTIPRLRTKKTISAELGMPAEVVAKVLDFLVQNELLKKEAEVYEPTLNWTRLGKDSPHIVKHHTNWRMQAVQHLELQTDEDLHYSGVFTFDRATALRAKDRFLDLLSTQAKDIEAAPSEALYSVGVDLFRIGRRG